MTDIKLLPLPLKQALDLHIPSGVRFYGHSNESMQHYARANIAHATAEKDAEIDALRTRLEDTVRDSTNKIETLRAEMEVWKASFEQAAAGHATYAERAERLAEAIKAYKSECDNPAKDYVLRAKRRDEMFALLRDHDQEVGNGRS